MSLIEAQRGASIAIYRRNGTPGYVQHTFADALEVLKGAELVEEIDGRWYFAEHVLWEDARYVVDTVDDMLSRARHDRLLKQIQGAL